METLLVQLFAGQLECHQFIQVLLSQLSESLQQFIKRLALALFVHRIAVERFKGLAVAMLQDDLQPRHPVCSFTVEQVANYIEGAEGVLAIVG